MARTNIDVANAACTLCGIPLISSFEGEEAHHHILTANYDDIVEASISFYYWRFAMHVAELTREDGSPTNPEWDASYIIPTEFLNIKAVTVNGYPIEFDVYGQQLLCNASATDTVVLEGCINVDEDRWPAYFRRSISMEIATLLAAGVREDSGMAKTYAGLAKTYMDKAKLQSSLGRTPERLAIGRLVSRRRGAS